MKQWRLLQRLEGGGPAGADDVLAPATWTCLAALTALTHLDLRQLASVGGQRPCSASLQPGTSASGQRCRLCACDCSECSRSASRGTCPRQPCHLLCGVGLCRPRPKVWTVAAGPGHL